MRFNRETKRTKKGRDYQKIYGQTKGGRSVAPSPPEYATETDRRTDYTHIRLLNKRLTDRNLNNEIVNIVVTAQSLINVTVKISVNKISIKETCSTCRQTEIQSQERSVYYSRILDTDVDSQSLAVSQQVTHKAGGRLPCDPDIFPRVYSLPGNFPSLFTRCRIFPLPSQPPANLQYKAIYR